MTRLHCDGRPALGSGAVGLPVGNRRNAGGKAVATFAVEAT